MQIQTPTESSVDSGQLDVVQAQACDSLRCGRMDGYDIVYNTSNPDFYGPGISLYAFSDQPSSQSRSFLVQFFDYHGYALFPYRDVV
jgi:hypothetical protein